MSHTYPLYLEQPELFQPYIAFKNISNNIYEYRGEKAIEPYKNAHQRAHNNGLLRNETPFIVPENWKEYAKPQSSTRMGKNNATVKAGDEIEVYIAWTGMGLMDHKPLKGIEVSIADTANENIIQTTHVTDTLGSFTLTAPRDDYEFIATLKAAYGKVSINFFDTTGNKAAPMAYKLPSIELNFNTMIERDEDGNPVKSIHTAQTLIGTTDKEIELNNKDLPSKLIAGDKWILQNIWSSLYVAAEIRKTAISHMGMEDSKIGNLHLLQKKDGDEKIKWGGYYCTPEVTAALPADCPVEKAVNFNVGILGYSNDVIDFFAHEIWHHFDYVYKITPITGGAHNANVDNQYDHAPETSTYQNKQNSISLVISEGLGTWFPVALNENLNDFSMGIKDQTFMTANLTNSGGSPAIFGEDAEFGVARLAWALATADNPTNQRAKCQDCRDQINYSHLALVELIKGKNLKSVSDLYKVFYEAYTGQPGTYFDGKVASSPINTAVLDKSHQIGVIFAEYGIAPAVDDIANNLIFMDLDDPSQAKPLIAWSQHKTGTMPGLDQFELFIFNKGKTELLYKMAIPSAELLKNGNNFSYRLTQTDFDALVDKLKMDNKDQIHLIIKGTASGQGVAKGAVPTGPYFSNLGTYAVPLFKKKAVIAVDSSGSNSWTDPSFMRIGAAHSMLKNMADRNMLIRSGLPPLPGETETYTAAIDFDSWTYILANFTEPQILFNSRIFNSIDDWGGTDVARAINVSVGLIRPSSTPSTGVFPNQDKVYVLTDMDNGGGMFPIIAAVNNATAKKIPVNVGHLVPLVTSRSQSPLAAGLRGDHSPRLTRIAEPMDALIEALVAGGGSYATITDPAAQQAWVDLMDELNNTNPLTRTSINLPLDVKIYGVAVANDGRDEPDYVYTADQSGVIKITVDGKGNFIPTLTVNGTAGTQTSLGNDLYEMEFTVTQGQAYRINLNEAASDAGLYNIMLQRISTFAAPGEIEPIPAMSAWFLISLIVSASSLVMLSRRKYG